MPDSFLIIARKWLWALRTSHRLPVSAVGSSISSHRWRPVRTNGVAGIWRISVETVHRDKQRFSPCDCRSIRL